MNDETERQIEWLKDCSRYFEKRPTHGEDMAHWSNTQNAENVLRVAEKIEAQSARITELEAERDEARGNYESAVHGRQEMHLGLRKQRERAEAAEARAERLAGALEPFAKCADELDGNEDVPRAPDGEWAKFRLLTDDYRRARATLSDTPEPAPVEAEPTETQAMLLDLIGELGREVYYLLDDCETSGPDGQEVHTITAESFDKVSAILDRIEGLPFEEPGYILGPGAMLQAAIKQTFLAAPPAPAVKVKALEWRDVVPNLWEAGTTIETYEIAVFDDEGLKVRLKKASSILPIWYEEEAEAFAAAQADYEQRILSALTTGGDHDG